MIDFKDKDAQVPSALIIIAILIFMGAVGYRLLVPIPKPKSSFALKNSQKSIESATNQAKLSTEAADADVARAVYRGTTEEVTAHLLAQLTDRAFKQQVQITAFRPQKTNDLPGLTELPISVQVSGAYTQLIAYLDAIQQPGSRIAVRSFQVASTGDSTSTVSATIGISVYSPAADDIEVKDVAARTARATRRPAATPSAEAQASPPAAKVGSNG